VTSYVSVIVTHFVCFTVSEIWRDFRCRYRTGWSEVQDCEIWPEETWNIYECL